MTARGPIRDGRLTAPDDPQTGLTEWRQRERDSRGYRRLVRRCRRIDHALDIPTPFDEQQLVQRVARQRGRPIELMPIAARADLPCGLLIAADRADYILYRADTGPLHRRHILVHEIAHLLFDHTASAPVVLTGALMPLLSPSLVQRVLGRTVYTEPQEQEAELLASLILSRAQWGSAAGSPESRVGGPRLESLFNGPAPTGGSGPDAVSGDG